MFIVEIDLPENDRLNHEMNMMWGWLNRQKYEPSVFRYQFLRSGISFRVEFPLKAHASAFASAFGGKLAPRFAHS